MGKPSVRYHWATLANYGGGPASGTATRVAPSSGLQDEGWRPDDEPGAQVANALFGNFADWIAYLDANAVDGSLVIGGAAVTIANTTFTATSGTPGSLTATAHGLQTGDGPVRVSNSGGGLPGGLASGTDYWVIVVDANTLRLAVDRTNALRATPIPVTITSNGTGTQTLSPGTSPTRLGDLTVTRTLAVNGTAQTAHKLKVGGMNFSFPSFVFTASSATDKLTFTDHGLKTGDGPVQVSNSGGALPTGLSASTNYWVITVDTSNIKLATSYLNAIAVPAIDLTSDGSGTNTLAATANTVAPADCEVTGGLTVDGAATVSGSASVTGLITASAGLTAAADQHVTVSGTGLHKHGTRTIKVPINAPRTGNGPGITGDVFTMTGTAQAAVFLIPWLPNGARILGGKARIKDNATGPTTMNFQILPSVDGAEQAALGTSSTSDGSGNTQTLPISGLTTTVAALTSYYARINTMSGSALQTIYAIEIDYDQP